jgi:hypothetical protein
MNLNYSTRTCTVDTTVQRLLRTPSIPENSVLKTYSTFPFPLSPLTLTHEHSIISPIFTHTGTDLPSRDRHTEFLARWEHGWIQYSVPSNLFRMKVSAECGLWSVTCHCGVIHESVPRFPGDCEERFLMVTTSPSTLLLH